MNISHYAKSIAYVIVSLFGALGAALTDGRVTLPELVNIGITLVGALVVWVVPNFKGTVFTALKGVMAFLIAALLALQPFVTTGHVTLAEWFQVGIAAFAAIGVIIVPNEPKKILDAGVSSDGAAVVTSVQPNPTPAITA